MQVISRCIQFHPQIIRTRIQEASRSLAPLSFSFDGDVDMAVYKNDDGDDDAELQKLHRSKQLRLKISFLL